MSTLVSEETISQEINHHGGPDICPRCKSQGYRGTMLVTRWPGEGCCINCGHRCYSNGHGRRPAALLSRTVHYLVAEKPSSDELPTLVHDSSIFRAFAQFLEGCAASNGGCERCRAKRKCRALYDRGERIAGQGQFNLRYYRLFSKKALDLLKTP